MGSPDDRERRGEDEKGLSSLAEAYQKAGPYIGASTTLVASVGVFAGLGWWLDQKFGHRTPWFLLGGHSWGWSGVS